MEMLRDFATPLEKLLEVLSLLKTCKQAENGVRSKGSSKFSVLRAMLLTSWVTCPCLLGPSAPFWAMCCLVLRSHRSPWTVASFPLKASRSGGLCFWHLIWTALSLTISGSRQVCAGKLIYSLVKSHMWGSTTHYTGIRLHWESACWPTLVCRGLLPYLRCLSMCCHDTGSFRWCSIY